MTNTYKCKHCKQEFAKSQSLGAHVPRCKENPNYEANMQKFKSSDNKSHKMSEAAKQKISQSMKDNARQKLGKKTNRFSIKYKQYTFKNKWELIFALWCENNNKSYGYESYSVDGKTGTFVSDFNINTTIYQIGWYERALSVKTFKAAGYKTEWLCGADIEKMRQSLPKETLTQFGLQNPLDSSKRWTILPRKASDLKLRSEAEKILGRPLETWEFAYKNKETNTLMVFAHIADYVLFTDKKEIEKSNWQDQEGVWHCE